MSCSVLKVLAKRDEERMNGEGKKLFIESLLGKSTLPLDGIT
jgi:hypothetical protein